MTAVGGSNQATGTDATAPSIAVDTSNDTTTEPDARWRVTGALDSTPFKKTTFIATSELTRAA